MHGTSSMSNTRQHTVFYNVKPPEVTVESLFCLNDHMNPANMVCKASDLYLFPTPVTPAAHLQQQTPACATTPTSAWYPSWLPAGRQVDSGCAAVGLGRAGPGCVQPAGLSWRAPAAGCGGGAGPGAQCSDASSPPPPLPSAPFLTLFSGLLATAGWVREAMKRHSRDFTVQLLLFLNKVKRKWMSFWSPFLTAGWRRENPKRLIFIVLSRISTKF